MRSGFKIVRLTGSLKEEVEGERILEVVILVVEVLEKILIRILPLGVV